MGIGKSQIEASDKACDNHGDRASISGVRKHERQRRRSFLADHKAERPSPYMQPQNFNGSLLSSRPASSASGGRRFVSSDLYQRGPTATATAAHAPVITHHGQYSPGTDRSMPPASSRMQYASRNVLEIRAFMANAKLSDRRPTGKLEGARHGDQSLRWRFSHPRAAPVDLYSAAVRDQHTPDRRSVALRSHCRTAQY